MSGGERDVVLIGAGGFGRETAEAVRAARQAGSPWQLLGYLDDDVARHGTAVDGVPVLGPLGELSRLPDAKVVISTGRPDDYGSRARIAARLGLPAERYATIVHPTAVVSATSTIGPGSVLLAHVVLTAAVEVGAHVAVMPHVTMTHDDRISDFVTLATGVALGGGVQVNRGAYIGAGALVREYRTVGVGAMVGMGAIVLRDVPGGEVWVGAPARFLRPAAGANTASGKELT
jgi:sugar O-acyltransferase (sialic acid O-acetyltransferase NeuD family)